MKYFLAVILCVVVLAIPSSARAHVVLKSTQDTLVGVLHISPGDDPVVGEEASLYLDISSQGFDTGKYAFDASIRSGDDIARPAVEIEGRALLRINYTFPKAGVYEIDIVARPLDGSASVTFQHTQRVTRGQAGVAAPRDTGWAEALVIGSAIGLLAILVIVINRRRLISTFARDEPKRR